ncbi:hypothetical protein [Chamaesiphon sp. VAR_48_metabat_403]|uniref:hypothetical protein n=1 Tax=Chamaesiphon sp. VAR_48_metabat_403 TaxID=2964700 RepID=UPI00286E03F7|nr:hypothetical protein [Chamaesiphon sp. VAR_48_metabat_403]
MQDLPFFVKHKFFEFLNDEESIDNFEKWSYETTILTDVLEKEDYLNLISVDFCRSNTKHEIVKIINKYIDASEYGLWKLKNILTDFVNISENSQDILFKFYELYCDGYYFLDCLGLRYGLSAIANAEPNEYGDKLSIEEQSKAIDDLIPEAIIEAQRVLTWLETRKIEIVKRDDDDRGLFIDRRTEAEKQPI